MSIETPESALPPATSKSCAACGCDLALAHMVRKQLARGTARDVRGYSLVRRRVVVQRFPLCPVCLAQVQAYPRLAFSLRATEAVSCSDKAENQEPGDDTEITDPVRLLRLLEAAYPAEKAS
jgi:hypothetical protein